MRMSQRPHSSWAEVYDIVYQHSFGDFYARLTDATVEVIASKVPPPAKIVDFGAGTGRLSIPLSRNGYDVTAIEPCQEMLIQLRRKDLDNLITTVCARMEDFRDEGKFDVALCVFTVISYLLDEESLKKALSAAYGALNHNGMLLIDIPSRMIFQSYSRKDDVHQRFVSVTEENEDIYRYQEELTVRESSGKESTYSDEFKIRYWPSDYVSNILVTIGFALEADLTDHFSGTGSHYWIMKKAERTRIDCA